MPEKYEFAAVGQEWERNVDDLPRATMWSPVRSSAQTHAISMANVTYFAPSDHRRFMYLCFSAFFASDGFAYLRYRHVGASASDVLVRRSLHKGRMCLTIDVAKTGHMTRIRAFSLGGDCKFHRLYKSSQRLSARTLVYDVKEHLIRNDMNYVTRNTQVALLNSNNDVFKANNAYLVINPRAKTTDTRQTLITKYFKRRRM